MVDVIQGDVMLDDRTVNAFPRAAMWNFSSVGNEVPRCTARRLGQVHAVLGCNHARGYKSERHGLQTHAFHPKARSPHPITTP